MPDPILNIDALQIAYPGSPDWAVDGVSLQLNPGDRLGLVGESGCGKSTLGRAAMRLLPPASRIKGQVHFQGEPVFEFLPKRLRHFRGEAVALIFQDPMTRLDPLMTIGDHCRETLQAHQPHLSRQQVKAKVISTLEAVNIPPNRWQQYPHEFSGGMRQRVAIALALLLDPKLIVADEPTTSLDVTVSAQILKELTRLCQDRQMALMLISHDLAMIGEYCDRIAVMHRGKIVEAGDARTVLTEPTHPYTQSLLAAALLIQAEQGTDEGRGDGEDEEAGESLKIKPGGASEALKRDESKNSPLLRLRGLKQHYRLEQNFVAQFLRRGDDATIRAVDGIDLELYPGETLGLVGESGCGKSTLSRTVLQLIRPTAGHVEWLGQDLTIVSRAEIRRQRRQMQMIFQDPHACLNPMMTVGRGIADPLLVHQLATAPEAEIQVHQMLERVGLTPASDFYHRFPGDLSGGQQQRVAIARALITRPKLVICDEPVSMLDATVQTQVLELMMELKQAFELTYLFITHDLWVARFFCDRIAVMNGGKIVELGTTKKIFTQAEHPYTQTLLDAAPLLARASH